MITLNPLFSDSAIFQQKKPIPIWGKATAGHRLKAEFSGVKIYTKATADENFMFHFPPVEAGGPFTLKITDLDTSENITVKDILVGEVWLASGQSNMEYTLGSDCVQSPAEDAHGPDCVNRIQENEFCSTINDSSKIRFFTVRQKASGLEEVSCNGIWRYMTSENAPSASAVAAWFSRFLQEQINVPVGLIITAWGGSVIEAWISRAGLLSNPDTESLVYETDKILNDKNCWNRPEELCVEISADKCLDPGNKGFELGWANIDFNDSEWNEMEIPGSWISQKISGNGAGWVRKEIEIPEDWIGKELLLNMGGIDKHDITYFNGIKIGEMGNGADASYWNTKRKYPIPVDLIKAGKNIIAIRAYSFLFDGSFRGTKNKYYISVKESDKKLSISGKWKAKAELDLGILSPGAVLSGPGNHNTPGILFNSMIRPLIPFAIQGVIWYQGESNAHSVSDALMYENKLISLINDWRYQWGQGNFPFIQVQLANYSPESDPEFVSNSKWAILREAQRVVSEKLPHVFMCTAVDAGELTDIHPQDKKTVGYRMAVNALYHVYGHQNVVPFGPLYLNYSVEKNHIRIRFRYAEGINIRENLPQSFYIAGKDRIFHPATSVEIEGNSVCVSCEKVPNPYAIRYGWSDAIISTVYNAAGLPASPFRTDTWDFNT